MKKSIVLLFGLIILFACNKKSEKKKTVIGGSIVGTWELRTFSAAMTPGVATLPSGNGNKLKFTEEHYTRFENGQEIRSGKYQILPDSTVEESVCLVMPENQYTKRIVFENNPDTTKVFFEIIDNSLNIISGCYAYDAGSKQGYEKVDDSE